MRKLLFFLSLPLFAQNPLFVYSSLGPPGGGGGSCGTLVLPLYIDSAGNQWQCISTIWTKTNGSSTGLGSVGLSMPGVFSVANSPLIANGTIAVTFAGAQTQNEFLGTPNGASGAISLRSIVNADLPTSGVSAGSYTLSSITVNSQGIITSASNGSGSALTIQTNGTNNTTQTGLNFINSTVNSVGLTITASNPGTTQEKLEITGSSYSGNAATATLATNVAYTGITGLGTGVQAALARAVNGTSGNICLSDGSCVSGSGITYQGTPIVGNIVTAYSSSQVQAPSTNPSIDSSGNVVAGGTITAGPSASCSGCAGVMFLPQGTTNTAISGTGGIQSPPTITTPWLLTTFTAPGTGYLYVTNSSGNMALSVNSGTGSGCASSANNVIQKGNGSGGCAGSSLTDNGTTVVETEGIETTGTWITPTSNGQGILAAGANAFGSYSAAQFGLVLGGKGSSGDVALANDAANVICDIPTGTTNFNCDNIITGNLTITGTCTGCSGGGGSGLINSVATDFVTTKTSGTLLTVNPGTYRIGYAGYLYAGNSTFTLVQNAISMVSQAAQAVLTVSTTGSVHLGDTIFINGATGSGCTGLNGLQTIVNITGSTISIAYNSNGCTYGGSGVLGANPTASGTGYIYGDNEGNLTLMMPASAGLLVAGAGGPTPIPVVIQSSTPGFGPGSVPIAQFTLNNTGNGNYAAVTDGRGFMSTTAILAAAGLLNNEAGGINTIGIDPSIVPQLGAGNIWTGSSDCSACVYASPMPVLATAPVTCAVGQQFFDSAASAGANLYGCTSANTWTVETGGGGGGGGTVTSVATTSPITGGTFTTSGTIGCATCLTTAGGQTISGTDAFTNLRSTGWFTLGPGTYTPDLSSTTKLEYSASGAAASLTDSGGENAISLWVSSSEIAFRCYVNSTYSLDVGNGACDAVSNTGEYDITAGYHTGANPLLFYMNPTTGVAGISNTSNTSTFRVGGSSLYGCLEAGNSDGSAGVNYMTVLNGVLSVYDSAHKPSICQ